MKRNIKEGKMTGNSPTQTGAMTGRFMGRLKRSIASGETDPSVLDKKRAQAKRIQVKTADRQSKYAPSHGRDPEQTFNQSYDRFAKSYRRGQYGEKSEIVRAARIALAEAVLNQLRRKP